MQKRTLILLHVAGIILGLGPLSLGEVTKPTRHYLYEGQAIQLEVDESRVAIYSRGADMGALGALLDPSPALPSGVTFGERTAHDVVGWEFIELMPGPDRAAPASFESLIAEIAAQNENLFVSPVFEGDHGPLLICPELLVKFHDDITQEEADLLLAELGLGIVLDRDFAGIDDLYRIRSATNDGFVALARANEASGFPEVEYAEPDMLTTALLAGGPITPNDTLFTSLWGIHNTGQSGGLLDFDMDGPEAWEITPGDPSIIVAVMDNGVQISHPDLNTIPGVDMTGVTPDGSHDPNNPCDGHGTLVAGTIAAIRNNAVGVVGIAPDCTVTSTKIFQSNSTQPCDGSGVVQSSWVASALNWSANNGVRVTNTSLSIQPSSTVTNAYTSTSNGGMVHFAASGNGAASFVSYPASVSAVNAVGAADRDGNRASFSQYGPNLLLMGPGVSITSTDWPDTYRSANGTSFSSPYTAGVAALVLSRNSALSSEEVRQILIDSATDMGTPGLDTFTGYGMVNALGALSDVQPPDPPEPFGLISPASAATNIDVNPTFMWETSANATSYLIEVDDFSNFSSPEIAEIVTETTYDHAGQPLPINRAFWWRVTSSNSAGMVQTPSQFFQTLSDPPGNFALDTPVNFAGPLSATPSFTWFPSTLASDYRILISVNQNLSDPAIDDTVPTPGYTVISPLDPSTGYFWSVQARNAVGTTTSSPFARQFSTEAFAPLAFNLLAPSGTFVSTRSPTFMWSESVGAESYTLSIAFDAEFQNMAHEVQSLTETAHQIPAGTLWNRRLYYWKVDALNASGVTTASQSPRIISTSFSLCQGDADFNGIINFVDITVVLNNWGQIYAPLTGMGDALDDGVVNFTDITAVLNGWLDVCE